MARRVGKRKQPLKEEFQLKELEKVEGGIFDRTTMIYLSKFFNAKIISKIEFNIARGKEADIYLADSGSNIGTNTKYVAMKFFRVETSTFNNMKDYIVGDDRFSRIRANKRFIINMWCKKEYGNLKIAEAAGVPAPKPYMFNGSILAMEFIGDSDGVSSPTLKDVELQHPEGTFSKITDYIKKLYGIGLVHADLSEYNILMREDKPYLIDFGQAVMIKHPMASQFLDRDIMNIVNYFNKRYSLGADFDEVKNLVVKY
ncbi:MAG: serine protein kinase RIO [Candidatus Micrarchaeia archaeon]